MPGLVAGGADLTGNTGTALDDTPAIADPRARRSRQIHFGIREHGMGAVMNGMAVQRRSLPVGGTFFVFSDYMRGAVRLAALSQATRSLFVWTHDSVGLGEDGPTHQPIEQLAALRAMPGLRVIRPADANETAPGLARRTSTATGPTALDPHPPEACRCSRAPPTRAADGVPRGAYVLVDEVGRRASTSCSSAPAPRCRSASAAADARRRRRRRCGSCRCRPGSSSPRRPTSTATRCCPPDVPTLAVEAGATFGWERYADDTVGIDHFGASAPGRRRPARSSASPPSTSPRAPARWLDERSGLTMTERRSHELNDFGQSPWFDNLARPLLTGGGLAKLVEVDGIRGVTSNPTIFEKAIAAGEGYDEQLGEVREGRPLDRGHLLGRS